jgi:hypothetical protein
VGRLMRVVCCLCVAVSACSSTNTKTKAAKNAGVDTTLGLDVNTTIDPNAPATTGGAANGAKATKKSTRVTLPGGLAAPAPASKSCTLQVGITYSVDNSVAAAALGHPFQGGGPDVNAAERQMQDRVKRAMDYVNTHGGFGGCTVTPVNYSFKTTGNDWVAQAQQECSLFTEDNHIFVAIPGVFETWPLVDCLAAKNVPTVWTGGLASFPMQAGKADYDKYKGLLYETEPSIDRLGPVIDELADRGYFTPGTKLGILGFAAYDNGARAKHLINDVWKPRLAAHKVTVASTYVARGPSGFSDLSTTANDCQSAVLQFRAAQVNHVLWALSGRGNRFECDPTFDAQRYYPRQAFTSYDGSYTTTSDNASYLKDSMLVGWLPTLDPGGATLVMKNAATDTCNKIFAGIEGNPPYFFCDALFFIQQALGSASGKPTTATLRAGAEGLGRNFTSATTFSPAYFGPGRFDGATTIQTLKYDAAKAAYLVAGPTRPLP